MAARPKGIRISELAGRTGTTRETIHFYLREGLLDRPKKTSRNMAYYDERHVEQLLLIRKLRSESYLPLAAIKKVLAEGKLGARARHLDLSGELFGRGAKTDMEPLSREELATRTGADEARLARYEAAGLLRPTDDPGAPRYDHADLRAVELIRQAETEGGVGNEDLMLERFEILERHMRALVQEEVQHFFGRVVTEGSPERTLELLRGGRETIQRYMTLARARHLRREVDAMLPTLEQSLESAPPEPLFFALDPAVADELGEPAERARLQGLVEAWPKDPGAQVNLLRHLLLHGDGAAARVAFEAAPERLQAHAELGLLGAEALLLEEAWDEAFTRLDQLRRRERRASPWLEALWGAAVLIRIRERFKSLDSSTELISLLSRAFSAFETARAASGEPELVRLRILLLLGRIEVGAPAFLGTRAQGLEDLEQAQQILQSLEAADTSEAAQAALGFGALVYLRLNVDRFLAQASA